MAAQRQIDRDAIDPRVEGTVSLELVELLERAHERVLQDVLGVLGRTGEPQNRRVQPFLVAFHQDVERVGPAGPTGFHEAMIVKAPGHHHCWTSELGLEFPQIALTSVVGLRAAGRTIAIHPTATPIKSHLLGGPSPSGNRFTPAAIRATTIDEADGTRCGCDAPSRIDRAGRRRIKALRRDEEV